MPSSRATASAVLLLSPVIMAASMPISLRRLSVSRAVGLIASATATSPEGSPSTATNIGVLPATASAVAFSSSLKTSTPLSSISLRLPTKTVCRYQEMAAEGLLDFEELRVQLAALDDTRKTAEQELR